MEIGKSIRLWRTFKNVSQAELAEKIGTRHSAISNIENGRQKPFYATVEKIANALGVTVEQLAATTMEEEK